MLSIIRISSIVYSFCLAIMLIPPACTKQNNPDQNKKIKDAPTSELGTVFPEIREIKNDTAKLALYPYATFFIIDLGLKGSEQKLKMIREANKSDVPVKVKVFRDNRSEVAEIYPATKQDIDKYKKH
jgi:hypothetical protein